MYLLKDRIKSVIRKNFGGIVPKLLNENGDSMAKENKECFYVNFI